MQGLADKFSGKFWLISSVDLFVKVLNTFVGNTV